MSLHLWSIRSSKHTMEGLASLQKVYDDLWERRDRRSDGLPLLSSPLPTLFICLTYVFIVKVAGPWWMKNREPYNIRTFLIYYNGFQVALSTYIFVQVRKKTRLKLFLKVTFGLFSLKARSLRMDIWWLQLTMPARGLLRQSYRQNDAASLLCVLPFQVLRVYWYGKRNLRILIYLSNCIFFSFDIYFFAKARLTRIHTIIY